MHVSLPPDLPGQQQLGPYLLHERIAVGGMAELFRAALRQGAGDDRLVVVKRMLPRIASDLSARAMFGEEARLGTHIRHRNVVQVVDYGDTDENPFIVLEFVRGVDLWRLMRFLTRTGNTLSVPQAVFVAREMLAGLHAVHEATDERGVRLGVVHRDVSPSNVLLSIHGEIKLGDLGIARSRLREKFPSTSLSERAKGKLGYLAPEQVRGGESDRRADIFSAGVVTAELLMGRPLFAGGSELAVLLAIRDSKIHPFLEFASRLPSGLGEVVIEALAQKPGRRHATAELFASRLLPYQTDPPEVLRESLAELVLEALESAPARLPVHLTPTRTQTNPEQLFQSSERSTPCTDEATPIRDVEPAALLDSTAPPKSYDVLTTAGEQLGPWSLAQMVQAISTGRLGPLDQIASEHGTARPLSEWPELARHLPLSTLTTSSLEPAASNAKLSGELTPLDDGGIVVALARAAVERSTALMLCELGGVRKEVYVKDGAPAFVTSNLAGELLGEHLVTQNVISRGELDMALAVMPRFEGRLGDTLSALGLVEPVVLFRHIATQVRLKLIDLFLWTSGSCTHYHGVAPPPSGFPLNIDAWEVLDEGLKARIERELEEPRLHILRTRRLVPASGQQLSGMRTALPQRMKRLLTELDRPRSIPDLAVRLSDQQDPEQLVRDAVLLLHVGALRAAE